MSNLTPEDVDVRLTTVQNTLDGEDTRLWQGLEDEKISRIAGDEANKQFTTTVQEANQGTERRLSTEVIHREEGDLRNISSLTELALALSDYRIKTDLELNIEKIAREQLGVDLNARIDGFVATWDHQVFTIFQSIQAVQTDVNMKYASMDQRIKKYEDMLQDITMDSIQITMDNGEINMGAWTILSQAREWDLEIIGMFKDYKTDTDKTIDDAIKDIESKIPITEDIINEALEALSDAPIIKELEKELNGLEVTIDGVTQTMMEHRTEWQNEMVDVSKALGDKVDAETTARKEALQAETKARTDEIRKETATRTEQFRELDDGLTVEIQERIDGDNKAYELIENLKASSEGSLADVYNKIAVNTTGIEANATAIQQVTAEVEVAKDDAGKALVNSATALEQANSAVTQTTALAERVQGVEVSVGDKVDTSVFNITKAEVERIDGVTKNHTEQLTTIDSTLNTMDGVVKGHTSAIEALTVKQTESDGKLTLVTERTTALESSVGGLRTDLNANVQAVTNLKTVVDKQGSDLNVLSQDVSTVKARVDNLKAGGTNLLKKSNTSINWDPANPKYPHGQINLSEPWVEGETYTLTVCITTVINDGSALAFYAGGGQQQLNAFGTSKPREVLVTKFVKDGYDIGHALINIYQLGFTGDPNTVSVVHWAVLQRGDAIGVTYWEPGMGDLADADNASAEALRLLQAEVTVIDGKVKANADNLTTLNTKVDNNHSEMILNYYTRTEADQTTSNMINSFKSTLSVGGRNLVRNSALPVSGNYWLFQEPLTRKISGEVTITWEVEDLSGQPVAGGLGFNMGDGGASGYEFIDYPSFATGKYKVTKATNSGAFTHLGFYSNTNCIIKNVKIEDGSVPSTWTPAPEDLEVGGRNLLYNSDFRKGLTYWSQYAATVVVTQETINNKLTKYAYISNVTSGSGGLYMQPVNIPYVAKAGDIMTVSFMGRGNGKMLIGFDDTYTEITVTPTWQKFSRTFKRKKSDNVIFFCTSATYADVALPKVELGDKATDWTPAPEDNIFEIEAQATAVNSITTDVSRIDGEVRSMASQVLTLESFKTNIQNGEIPGNSIREINLTDPAYNQDMYYPVMLSNIPTTSRTHLRLMATLDGGSKPAWSIHDGGFSINVDWEDTGSGWGTIDPERVINNAVWSFTVNGQSPLLGPDQDWTSSQPLIWLRGGGRYYYSVPSSRSIAICPANGTLTSTTGNSYGALPYNANQVPVSLNQSNKVQSVKLQQTNEVIDGVKAVSTVSVNNNGFMSGYGLISQLINGVVVSAFGVDADYFYVGKSMSNAKKPFMVLTSPQTIGGVTYPAGVWMDVAVIANATIGTAHIADASITNAKIVDLNAEKITAGIINADRIGANSITAEKLTIGTGANLWAQPKFQQFPPFSGNCSQYPWTPELSGWGVQCRGRDHIAPWSTRIPVNGGEQYVIEYTAGHNSGPAVSTGVGFWYTDIGGTYQTLQYPAGENIGAINGGWYRYRATLTVPIGTYINNAQLFIQIEQAENSGNPMVWTVGNLSIRRVNGGELIVNGSITANKLKVDELSAISTTLGTLTAYKDLNNPTGARMVMTGSLITVYDDNNKTRVRLGLW